MNRRERLMASLRGEPVDRPPFCFYELNGYDEHADDPDPFNIYNDPSWAPLIRLTADHTDRILMRGIPFKNSPPDPLIERTTIDAHIDAQGNRITMRRLRAADRELTQRERVDPDVRTTWTL